MGYPTKFDGLSSSISNLFFFGGVDQIFRHTNFKKWDVLEGNHLEIVNLNENVRFTLD
jgi:hypothetical protein